MSVGGVGPDVKPPSTLETNISLLKLLNTDDLGHYEQFIIGGILLCIF